MVEGEPKQLPEQLRSEQVKHEILEYFVGEKADSAKFTAFFDFYEEMWLRHTRDRDIEDLVDATKLNPSQRLIAESNLRIDEIRLALLENKIADNTSQLPRYNEALNFFEGISEDFHIAYTEEIGAKNQGVSDQQLSQLIGERFVMAWHYVRNTLLKNLE
ncbi:MAG TPA: hypothetical protein VJ327_09775 [Patescibacteria group bacterium]|nr:MAG: hypothetical protein A2899_02890 [Candidatus Amesbacteria bacterium RIFCSPLOWO2_01_FULL_49_25]HJZ06114.1 hypothetical protein [Patescibacteria group bacterium]